MKKYKWVIYKNKNYNEHRKIMEEYLNRKLHYNEVVHHKNGNTKDNNIENLIVMSRIDHAKLHGKFKQTQFVKIICDCCKKEFNLPQRKYNWNKKKLNQTKFYCSKLCTNNKQINKEFENKVINGLKENLNGSQISKKYNISKSQVYQHINRLLRNKNIPHEAVGMLSGFGKIEET